MDHNRKVVDLNLTEILPNRFQPRIKFDEKSILELAESIKEHGVIQPIVVRKIGDKYEIIAGERRYKASALAGKTTIPAIITELNDKESVEIALLENVQRENLTPIEEAVSYRKILDMGYLTQEQLAEKLGKTQSTIANKLRLLNLDEDVQEALLENRISERHARSLLKLKNNEDQKDMLNRIIKERLTVRRTDEEIDKMMNQNNNEEQPIVITPEMINIPNAPIVNDTVAEPTVTPVTPTQPVPQFINQNFNPINKTEEAPTVFGGVENINPIDLNMPTGGIVNDVPTPDVDHIAEVAETIYPEKPLADMNSLLQPTNSSSMETPVAPTINPFESMPLEPTTNDDEVDQMTLNSGKFFDILGEDENHTSEQPQPVLTPENQNFSFNSFFAQPIETSTNLDTPVESTTVVQPPMESSVEVPVAPAVEPTGPVEPTMPTPSYTVPEEVTPTVEPIETMDFGIPNVPTNFDVPVESTTVVQPSMESIVEVAPTPVVEPTGPVAPVGSVEPTIPEPSYSAPEMTAVSEVSPGVEEPTPTTTYAPQKDVNANYQAGPIPGMPEPQIIPSYDDLPLGPQPAPEAPKRDVLEAIQAIRDNLRKLESMGFKVDSDEFDLENMYQVIIKIEK